MGNEAEGEQQSDRSVRFDVNRDGKVSALDALMVIYQLEKDHIESNDRDDYFDVVDQAFGDFDRYESELLDLDSELF